MALSEIEAKLCGEWKLETSENFESFLEELGECYSFYAPS